MMEIKDIRRSNKIEEGGKQLLFKLHKKIEMHLNQFLKIRKKIKESSAQSQRMEF